MIRKTVLWRLLRRTYASYRADGAHLFAAAIALYGLMSLAPILVISITIASMILGEASARQRVIDQIALWLGPEVRPLLKEAYTQLKPAAAGLPTALASTLMVLWGATRTFVESSTSLDIVWNVDVGDDPWWKRGLRDRLIAFGLAMAMGLLLFALVLLSTAITFVRPYLGQHAAFESLFSVIHWLSSSVVLIMLCAAVFRVLPHTKIGWRKIWVGAIVTGVLLNIGRALIALYLGKAGITSVYGAAGTLMVILLWVYYSALIFFLGAEFTYVYSRWCDLARRLSMSSSTMAEKERL
jgi:membrane protein